MSQNVGFTRTRWERFVVLSQIQHKITYTIHFEAFVIVLVEAVLSFVGIREVFGTWFIAKINLRCASGPRALQLSKASRVAPGWIIHFQNDGKTPEICNDIQSTTVISFCFSHDFR